MGRDQHIVDELRSFERLCLELAAAATMAEEHEGLLEMAGGYRAEISDRERDHQFANTVPTRGFSSRLGRTRD